MATHEIACPNCGFEVTENYCGRCGQEAHLHQDTVRGLVVHFAHHWFHYESKFWQTLKTLWTRPGQLTLAYWNKQRMRYLPPISLYIFVSALFFLTSTLFPAASATDGQAAPSVVHAPVKEVKGTGVRYLISLTAQRLREKEALIDSNSESSTAFLQEVAHKLPKVFFFLIPVMALILRVLFLRSKKFRLVHHSIFSLHIHAFWFSAMTVTNLIPEGSIYYILTYIAFAAGIVYTTAAIKHAYATNWARGIAYSLVTNAVYMFFLVVALVAVFVFM